MQSRHAFLFGAFLFLSPLALQASAQTNSTQPPKWEYKEYAVCPEQPATILGIALPIEVQIEKAQRKAAEHTRTLKRLGEEGWELVKVERDGERYDQPIDSSSGCVTYYFKRQKTTAQNTAQGEPTDPIYPKCLLRSDKAPALQGLRLGMKKEEVMKLFKFSDAVTAQAANDTTQLPDEIEYGGLEPLTPTNNPSIRASVAFFDDELIRYRINYAFDHTWNWTLKEWKAKITNANALPDNAWDEFTENEQASYRMKCRDFTVETGAAGANDHWNVQVTSLSGLAKVKKAREFFMQAKRSEFKP